MQHIMNTNQSVLNDTLSQRIVPTASSLFPTAVASNQPPCINPWNLEGATLETKDNPIGLRNNSAMVSIR